jgi:hypothetical protein
MNNLISLQEGTNDIIFIWQKRREEFSLIYILCHDSSALYDTNLYYELINVKLLGLYTDLLFSVGIWLVFLDIYQTNTGGKLSRYLLVL